MIKRVELNKFKRFSNKTIDFLDGMTLVVGGNDIGFVSAKQI